MQHITNSIKIQHSTFGLILDETFVNPVQFKLFLKMVNGCVLAKEDLTFFNGVDFLVNIPYSILKECLITTKLDLKSITDEIISKSKIEQPS